jgi:chromosome segregation ATPase
VAAKWLRIDADRQQSEQALEAAEIEVAQTAAALARIQDAIETSIEAAITAIEEQFDRLDREAGGHGARLELEMRPPADATDT